MKIIEQYIVTYAGRLQVLYKCENGEYYMSYGDQKYIAGIVRIDQQHVIELISTANK